MQRIATSCKLSHSAKNFRRVRKSISKHAQKNVGSIIHIQASGETFSIATAVENKVDQLGLNIGSMESSEPRALADAQRVKYIAKWRNIDHEDYPQMDGFVLCSDYRDGTDAYIILFEQVEVPV